MEICSRCGTFLCGECVHYFRDITPSCASCLPLLEGSPATTRARLSPVLTSLGLLGFASGFVFRGRLGLLLWAAGFLLGFAGIAFGVQELRLIKAGQAGTRGRRWARAGLSLGAVFALGYGALLVIFLRFIWRFRGTEG